MKDTMWLIQTIDWMRATDTVSSLLFCGSQCHVIVPVKIRLQPTAEYLLQLLLRFKNGSSLNNCILFDKIWLTHDRCTFVNDDKRRVFRYDKTKDDFEVAGILDEPQYTNPKGNYMLP